MHPTRTHTLFLAGAMSAAAITFAGCGGPKPQRTPPLTAPAASNQPPQKNWVEKTTDATWNAVASPVQGMARAVTPQRKPKVVERLEPTEPPELVIITRERRGVVVEDGAGTQPVTQP